VLYSVLCGGYGVAWWWGFQMRWWWWFCVGDSGVVLISFGWVVRVVLDSDLG
jgi:hypothetical protein